MRIFYELRYTAIIEIVWTFYLKSVPAKFQKYFKLISWAFSGTSSSKPSCNPRHPSRNISCNHRHHLLQPSWRRIFSTSNNQKTRVDSDINIDYKASSFDKLYIWRRNETQRALLGHTNGNIEMRSPSAAAMLTMVAAATIVRFPPVVCGVFTGWHESSSVGGHNPVFHHVGWSSGYFDQGHTDGGWTQRGLPDR